MSWEERGGETKERGSYGSGRRGGRDGRKEKDIWIRDGDRSKESNSNP